MTNPLTPEQRAAELLASVPHEPHCAGLGHYPRIVPDGCDCDQPIRAIMQARACGLEEAAGILSKAAAKLRTPAGRIAAEWHESDAEMVATELDRKADAIRSLKGNVS